MEREHRGGKKIAVLYCDLDKFKLINDTYGHGAGDVVLQATARRIRRVLRTSDFVARLGGDEIVVILDGVRDEDDAGRIAEMIKQEVGRPVVYEGAELHPSTSIGIALAFDGEARDDLIARADNALYRAKKGGLGIATEQSATPGT